jgi:hypothetical protein
MVVYIGAAHRTPASILGARCDTRCGVHAGRREYACEAASMTLKTQIAAKEHRCDKCGKSIPTGAKYLRHHTMTEAQGPGYRKHVRCCDYDHQPDLPDGFNNSSPKMRGPRR